MSKPGGVDETQSDPLPTEQLGTVSFAGGRGHPRRVCERVCSCGIPLQREGQGRAGGDAGGLACMAAGRREEARAALRRAIELAPDSPESRMHIPSLLEQLDADR